MLSRVIGRTLSGTVHTGGAASTVLTGVGTAFTTEVHVGDTLVLPGVGTRQVTAIGSAVALTLDAAVTIPGPPGLLAIGVSAPPGVQGTAHTAGIAATTLTGVGSSFTHDVRAGDTLVLPGVGTRQVTAIASDTALTVDAPVTIPGPPGVTLSRQLSLRLDVAADVVPRHLMEIGRTIQGLKRSDIQTVQGQAITGSQPHPCRNLRF